jgi:NADH-quinone oxidoreductase subunit J
MSTSGEIFVAICGIIAIATAIGTVAVRTPLRAAMALLAHVVSLAGLYLTLNAHLLAAIQLLVYAGAVVVLFVFVIMLMGPGAIDTRQDGRGLLTKTLGAAVLAMLAGGIAFAVGGVGDVGRPNIAPCPDGVGECGQFGGVDAVSNALFVGAAIPFELASILLLVAVVAAIAVARGRLIEEKEAIDPAKLPIRPKLVDPSDIPGNVEGEDGAAAADAAE